MNLSYLLTVLIWGTTWIARNATGRGGNRRVHRLSLLPWRHWCCLLCCCSAIACKLDKRGQLISAYAGPVPVLPELFCASTPPANGCPAAWWR
jgi:hypothetical protein